MSLSSSSFYLHKNTKTATQEQQARDIGINKAVPVSASIWSFQTRTAHLIESIQARQCHKFNGDAMLIQNCREATTHYMRNLLFKTVTTSEEHRTSTL